MIEKIQIQNFKSIRDLELELGRVNVFIGENGSGKTNILEAIGVSAAAGVKNLDEDYLALKGIRVNSPKMMKSGFNKDNQNEPVFITISVKGQSFTFKLEEEDNKKIWKNDEIRFEPKLAVNDFINTVGLLQLLENPKFIELYTKSLENSLDTKIEKVEVDKKINLAVKETIKLLPDTIGSDNWNNFVQNGQKEMLKVISDTKVTQFLIFCPENTLLRRTDTEGHTRPLGIRGEGLLSYISQLNQEKPDVFEAIKNELVLFSWFKDFEIYQDFLTGGSNVKLTDKFLAEGIKTIDLRNANEGFLFVLFYITLFTSEDTPQFFAIDNFDNALNPKLCSELIKILIKIAKEKGKQVILTTHNPAVLDGLDLKDDEQRLFVVSRKIETGDTKVKRILKKQTPFGESTTKLSESFMNGSIGGLPQNF